MKPMHYRAAMWSGLAIAAIASGSVARAAPATIAGTVRDLETGEPLPGAVVTLPDLHRTSITDAQGSHLFGELPGRRQHVGQGTAPVADGIEVEEDGARQVARQVVGPGVATAGRQVPGAVHDSERRITEPIGQPTGRDQAGCWHGWD